MAATLLAVAALLWASATPARACFAAPAIRNAHIAESEAIVGGRVLSWVPAAELDTDSGDVTTPIRVTMRVDATFRGEWGSTIEFVDHGSLSQGKDRNVWMGDLTCGTFSSEPTGKYFVVALTRDENGELRSSQLTLLFSGSQPSGDYLESVAHLYLGDREAPTLPLAVAAVAVPLVFVLAASFVFPAKGSQT